MSRFENQNSLDTLIKRQTNNEIIIFQIGKNKKKTFVFFKSFIEQHTFIARQTVN